MDTGLGKEQNGEMGSLIMPFSNHNILEYHSTPQLEVGIKTAGLVKHLSKQAELHREADNYTYRQAWNSSLLYFPPPWGLNDATEYSS